MSHTPSRLINSLFVLAAILCVVYYLAMGIFIRFGQSLDFMWLVFAFLFVLRFFLVGKMIRSGEPSPLPDWLIKLLHIGFGVFVTSFVIIEIMIASAFIQAPPANLDYIIVLGAKVNGTLPGGALRNRIQVAFEYWRDNPNTLIIASGGQGEDEGISEAQCIYNGLRSKGVPDTAIIMEDQSTSTYENMKYSLAKLDGQPYRIGIVTNNFHIFRALKIARGTGDYAFYGINVYTSHISFPHYMLREYFAVIVGWITGKW